MYVGRNVCVLVLNMYCCVCWLICSVCCGVLMVGFIVGSLMMLVLRLRCWMRMVRLI